MAALSLEEIEETIRSLGLFRNKAKAIKELSSILLEKYEGEVPNSLDLLETLPGVGHKTASVVAVQIFDIPAFPVDTHIHRTAKRWGLSCGKNVHKTEEDLKKLFPRELWGKVHLQIIFYAREFCPAKKHEFDNCIICKKCNGTNNCI